MSKRGYTLVEIMIACALTAVFSTAVLGVMLNSRTFWDKGQNKIAEQEEARRIIDTISGDLRQALSAIPASNEIIFYKVDFAGGNNWIDYRLSSGGAGCNPNCLERRVYETGDYSVIARHVQDIFFDNNANGSMVNITVTTYSGKNFTISSEVALRNFDLGSGAAEEAGDPPAGGDF